MSSEEATALLLAKIGQASRDAWEAAPEPVNGMTLYHGTSSRQRDDIRRDGLNGRSDTGPFLTADPRRAIAYAVRAAAYWQTMAADDGVCGACFGVTVPGDTEVFSAEPAGDLSVPAGVPAAWITEYEEFNAAHVYAVVEKRMRTVGLAALSWLEYCDAVERDQHHVAAVERQLGAARTGLIGRDVLRCRMPWVKSHGFELLDDMARNGEISRLDPVEIARRFQAAGLREREEVDAFKDRAMG